MNESDVGKLYELLSRFEDAINYAGETRLLAKDLQKKIRAEKEAIIGKTGELSMFFVQIGG